MQAFERVLRTMQHAPERVLHPWRRDRAAERLAGRIPSSVLFVCHGNLCRSPFAEALFAKLAREGLPIEVAASSLGFVGPGRPAPPQAIAAAARRGVAISGHVSRLLTARAIRAANLVVVMSAEQERTVRRAGGQDVEVLVLGDLDPLPITERTIVDPWGRSDDVFDASYDRIDRCLRALVQLMAS